MGIAQITDMFGGKPPRAKPRVMAHVIDGGADFVRFQCNKCDWDSDWLNIEENNLREKEFRCGIPCEICNKAK